MIKKILVFVFAFMFLTGLVYLGLSPIKKTIDYCENNNWDGSEHKIIVNEAFKKDPTEIIVLCNKNDESSAISGLVNAMYFWEDKE
jgi:hypothetical protein